MGQQLQTMVFRCQYGGNCRKLFRFKFLLHLKTSLGWVKTTQLL